MVATSAAVLFVLLCLSKISALFQAAVLVQQAIVAPFDDVSTRQMQADVATTVRSVS